MLLVNNFPASACAGYKSVAHYLVLTHQAEADVPQADSTSAAVPVESATASTGAKGDPALKNPAGEQAHAVKPEAGYQLKPERPLSYSLKPFRLERTQPWTHQLPNHEQGMV